MIAIEDNQVSSYGFRIRFLLPEDFAIEHDDETLDIPLPAANVRLLLQSRSGSSIADSRNLTIWGTGFPSEDKAHTCGLRTKNALMLCAALLRIGFDVGKDGAPSVIIKGLDEMGREKGVLCLPDVHGLSVFPEDRPVEFPSVALSGVSVKPPTKFVEKLGKAYEISSELTEKQSLALKLYSAALFESSLRATFLTLVTVVECLASPEEQPQHILDYLKELICLTRKTLKGPKRKEIVEGLARLNRESISRACRGMVEQHLGREAAKLFKKCYDARSRMVHDGKPPEDFNLGSYALRLDRLVSQLLIAVVISGRET